MDCFSSEHVLQPFLPDRPVLSYNLRRRPHCNKSLITKTADLSNNYLPVYHLSNLQRQLLTSLLTITILPFTLSCLTHFITFVSQLFYGCVCQLFNKRELRERERERERERGR